MCSSFQCRFFREPTSLRPEETRRQKTLESERVGEGDIYLKTAVAFVRKEVSPQQPHKKGGKGINTLTLFLALSSPAGASCWPIPTGNQRARGSLWKVSILEHRAWQRNKGKRCGGEDR